MGMRVVAAQILSVRGKLGGCLKTSIFVRVIFGRVGGSPSLSIFYGNLVRGIW